MSGVVTGGGGGVELYGIGRLALLCLVGLEWDDGAVVMPGTIKLVR